VTRSSLKPPPAVEVVVCVSSGKMKISNQTGTQHVKNQQQHSETMVFISRNSQKNLAISKFKSSVTSAEQYVICPSVIVLSNVAIKNLSKRLLHHLSLPNCVKKWVKPLLRERKQ